MPHDAKGNLLQIGDEVIMRCIVRRLASTEEYCNVDLETVYEMPQTHRPALIMAVNTHQLELNAAPRPVPLQGAISV